MLGRCNTRQHSTPFTRPCTRHVQGANGLRESGMAAVHCMCIRHCNVNFILFMTQAFMQHQG